MTDVEKDPIVIVSAARTALGGFQGVLSAVSGPELGARALAGAVERASLSAGEVDEVFMGCVLPAGVGQAPARQAALRGGLEDSVPATTINKVCGSGMKTVMLGADALAMDRASVVVAGGPIPFLVVGHQVVQRESVV